MDKNKEKTPGVVKTVYFICAHCGQENPLSEQFQIKPGGKFHVTLNNKRIEGHNPILRFYCTNCGRLTGLGLKQFYNPETDN